MSWTRTVSAESLRDERPVVVRCGRRQLAILRRGERVFAFDNRCPHEGYPLSEGRVDERCVLTCEWHNWKFDLADGRNLFGTDHLRVYPARIEDGRVLVDLAEPGAERARADCLASLRAAFDDRQYDRIARVLARLHFEGLDPRLAVEQAIRWSHDRFEYGTTHAYPAAADWLALAAAAAAERDLPRELAALTEAVDHMALDSLRQPRFPYTEAARAFEETAFLAAVEAEDEPAALAHLNGALAEGRGFAELEAPLARAALAHYRDYGHSLIYVHKAGELIAALGRGVTAPVLRALVRSIVYATREDLIPGFRGYASRLEKSRDVPLRDEPAQISLTPATGLPVGRAMDRVVTALASHPPEEILAALVEAAGDNLLRYDTRLDDRDDLPVSRNFGWLGATHAVTFAAALHDLARRHPDLWRPGLLQLACFTGRAQPFLDNGLDASRWAVADEEAFFQAALERVFDHGTREPIYACHLLKTALAARALAPHLPGGARAALLAGTGRFLHSPLKQKHVRRTARQAIALVGLDY